jgi:hypothetical protein
VYCFGGRPDDWKSLIVVSPLMEALIRLDGGASVDLERKSLKLPNFSKSFQLQVRPEHLEQQ